jgi:hypothetical protein
LTDQAHPSVRLLIHLQDAAEAQALREFAIRDDVHLEETRIRDLGVTAAVFLVAAPVLILRTVQDFLHWRQDQRLGGHVIDLSNDVPVIRRDAGAPLDHLIIIGRDGTVEVLVLESPDRLADLVATALKAVTSASVGPEGATSVTSGAENSTE